MNGRHDLRSYEATGAFAAPARKRFRPERQMNQYHSRFTGAPYQPSRFLSVEARFFFGLALQLLGCFRLHTCSVTTLRFCSEQGFGVSTAFIYLDVKIGTQSVHVWFTT